MNYLTVDVLDSGALQGSGPLYNILQAQVTTELSKAGQVAITVPATDTRAIALLSNGLELHLKTEFNTVARGLLQSLSVLQGDVPAYQLTGLDLLGELNYLNTGYNRVYNKVATSAAIIGTDATATSLLGGTGWTQGTVTIDVDATPHTSNFNGATRLAALIQLAKEIGHHFRQGATARELDFGIFGADSGIRIINVPNAGAQLPRSTDQAYVGTLTVLTISADIENKIFPLGQTGFDLRYCDTTNGTTAISDIKCEANQGPTGYTTTTDDSTSGAIVPCTATTGFIVGAEVFIGDADDWTQDHEVGIIESISAGVSITFTADVLNSYAAAVDVIQNPQFYITDATSVAANGTREGCPVFGWIKSFQGNADADLEQQAQEALYLTSQAHLLRYKDAYESYELGNIYGLPLDLLVGQKVKVRFQGSTGVFGGTSYLNVNDDFYVMKITRTFSANSGPLGICKLAVANVSRPMPSNMNVLMFNSITGRWVTV